MKKLLRRILSTRPSLPFVARGLACLFAAAVFTAAALPVPARAAAPAAEAAPVSVALALSGGQAAYSLTDQNRSTWVDFAGGDTITITADEPFAFLYLVWDSPPQPWRLAAGAEEALCGEGGWLHELAALEVPATEATITVGEGAHTLCDIYAFGAGALPAWVQQWQPTLQRADLLALPTHADDEHLFFGGILPTYAGERSLAVQVVYMTNHWGERYRPHELLDGLWTVGVTAYPLMGPFPDLFASKESLPAAEQTYGREEVLAFQVELLRRFKPKVVVGHDLNGEYGHGAHMLNASTLLEAVPLAADAAAYPDTAALYGAWEAPKVYLHLYPENQLTMDWNRPLAGFGGVTAFEMAEAGFAKHVSQITYFSVQQGGTWEDCRLFGLAHTTVGPDAAKDDLFENIDLTPEEPPPESAPISESAAPETPSSAPVSAPPASSLAALATPGAGALAAVLAGAVLLVAVLVFILVLIHRRGR